jgi:hypothetical protein
VNLSPKIEESALKNHLATSLSRNRGRHFTFSYGFNGSITIVDATDIKQVVSFTSYQTKQPFNLTQSL